ncbi:MAG: PQQ-binding-like beta-propeller repeat protein [Gemmatimonadaceae bacterium]|nr:PQQ-binding-like beta-propeller repeat protein [Gemmatimonadaceae bacterium]
MNVCSTLLAHRSVGARVCVSLIALAAAAGCSQLVFLKPPSVPRRKGASSTTRGPAFAASTASRAAASSADADWPLYNRSYDGTRFSPLAQITAANVASLTPACIFPLGVKANMQTGLVAVDGTLYFTTATETYAVDAASCALRWRHRYDYDPKPPFDPNKVNRGIAYLAGPDRARLFRGANDGRVMALDPATGDELWSAVAGDPETGETFPAAPIAWNGMVFMGNAGGDNFSVKGRLMAFDAKTGGRIWSFDLVPENGVAARTWPQGTERFPKVGGASWTSYALDTATGVVYTPTGNAAPDFIAEVRPGRNLYTYSVVALDSRGGTLKTFYQMLERDDHDWDVAAAPSLVSTHGGQHLVIAAGKDGHVYGTDQATGKRIFATPVSTLENTDAPLTGKGARFCPGVNGGVEWNGPSYSPRTNLLYVGSIDWCTTIATHSADQPGKLRGKEALPWTGSTALRAPFGVNDPTRRGWLTAIDADNGSIKWRYASPTPLIAGVTATAGDVVFTADLTGKILAFGAKDGHELWSYDAGAPIGGGVITYQVGETEYLAVAVGMNSPQGWKLESPPARVLVFKLR